MGDQPQAGARPRSSKLRYLEFVRDYKAGQLDEPEANRGKPVDDKKAERKQKRRAHLREYLRWLRPHRSAVGVLVVFALMVAGLEMIEPLFMRYIIDRVLLNAGLDYEGRLTHLHIAGLTFLG